MVQPNDAVDAAAEELYGCPLDDFIARRNELARRLRDEGRSTAAQEVSRLRKPVLSAWTVNQLARRESEKVRSLLDLAHRLQQAQDRDSLQEITKERRRLVHELTQDAEDLLQQEGHSASAGTLNDVRRTFQSATTDEEREAVARGVLTRPIEVSGFGQELGLPAQKPERTKADRDSERIRRLKQELRDAKKVAQQKRAEAKRAASAAKAAEDEATAAQRRVERIEQRLSEARSR